MLKAGPRGKAKIVTVTSGPSLDAPTLPLGVPAKIQLQSAGEACFETTVVTPRKNTASVLKANGG